MGVVFGKIAITRHQWETSCSASAGACWVSNLRPTLLDTFSSFGNHHARGSFNHKQQALDLQSSNRQSPHTGDALHNNNLWVQR